MKKHVAFDLDGVLVDALEIHRRAFVRAWNERCPYFGGMEISEAFHDLFLASMSTKQKLGQMMKMKMFPFGTDYEEQARQIGTRKQELTTTTIDRAKATVPWLHELIDRLRKADRLIALVSNSIRETCVTTTTNLGLADVFDVIVSSDDSLAPKPDPCPYLTAVRTLGESPTNFVAFEDSPTGIRSAREAGCWIYVVGDPSEDLKIERVERWLKTVDDC